MMPEMILIWGFRVAGILIWGERLIHDTHKRERTRKKNRSFRSEERRVGKEC